MVAIIIAHDSNGGWSSVDKIDMVPVFTELTGRRGGRQQTEAHEKHWAHGVSEQEA